MKLWEAFDQCRPKLLARLLQHGFSPTDAEDALQDALIRAAEGHQILASNEIAWQSWLTTTAANLLIDQLRHEASLPRVPLSQIAMSASSMSASSMSASSMSASSLESDFTSAVEFGILFHQAWSELSQPETELLLLKQQGYRCEEIAEQRDVPVERIKKQLQRARTHLQKELIQRGYGDLFTEKRILPRSKQIITHGNEHDGSDRR